MKKEPPLMNKGQVRIYMPIAIIALYMENFINRKPSIQRHGLKQKRLPG